MKRSSISPANIDTLIIVGNGFDLWQGLQTSYSAFRKFYLLHRDAIMNRLHIKMREYTGGDGETVRLSDVELIYGDPFRPEELGNEFWGSFEVSLENLDAEQLNLFFDKDRKGLRKMKKSVQNAKRILREAFCAWIASITIGPRDAGYRFGDNCFFINFNYTDTLQKRFGVDDDREYHIHGEAADKESMIFGHSAHPQLPEEMLLRLGGRFKGLYFVENLLYETDKHVEDNIQMLCIHLGLSGVDCQNIRHVYVLGHSMSAPDLAYFSFLSRATVMAEEATDTKEDDSPKEYDDLEELHNRLQFVIQRVGYHQDEDEIDPAYRDAMRRRYESEQADRSLMMQDEFAKMLRKAARRSRGKNAPQEAAPPEPVRTEPAKWHITYHGDEGKAPAEAMAQSLNLQSYQLYSGIDDCLAPFRSDR